MGKKEQAVLRLVGCWGLIFIGGCLSIHTTEKTPVNKLQQVERERAMVSRQETAPTTKPADRHLWQVHDTTRPLPPAVTPGTESTQEQPGTPPSDAIVLFDGKDLSKWVAKKDGGPARWKVENGYMEVVRGMGDISTREGFGDCQLHIEWMSPSPAKGKDQDRGNSGVYLMSTYEVQVLDSYNSPTYADGLAGAVYGQKPPLVNASCEPGKWQSYDIIFRRPIFQAGKAERPATITILHNGVLVQDHWVIEGQTLYMKRAFYQEHADKLPIMLQDHSHPVRFRNIWIRPLPEPEKFLKDAG